MSVWSQISVMMFKAETFGSSYLKRNVKTFPFIFSDSITACYLKTRKCEKLKKEFAERAECFDTRVNDPAESTLENGRKCSKESQWTLRECFSAFTRSLFEFLRLYSYFYRLFFLEGGVCSPWSVCRAAGSRMEPQGVAWSCMELHGAAWSCRPTFPQEFPGTLQFLTDAGSVERRSQVRNVCIHICPPSHQHLHTAIMTCL